MALRSVPRDSRRLHLLSSVSEALKGGIQEHDVLGRFPLEWAEPIQQDLKAKD